MKKENLITRGLSLKGWSGEIIADLGDVKARLFHFNAEKEMIMFEEGHEVNEWIIVLSGDVIVHTPEHTITLTTGDSFIVPPGVPHRLNTNNKAVGLIVRDMKKAPQGDLAGFIVDKIASI
jgi:quercetin dioxygenase-like cupin family protein